MCGGGAGSNELVLGDLSAPIVRGQTVSVAYVDSWLGDDVAAIQDLTGNDAASSDSWIRIDNGEENTTGRTPIMAFLREEWSPGNTLLLLFRTLFRSGFLGLFLIEQGSISHIAPPLSENRCSAD